MRRGAAMVLAVLSLGACSGASSPSDPDREFLSVPDNGDDRPDKEKKSEDAKDGSKVRSGAPDAGDREGKSKLGAPEGSGSAPGSGGRNHGAPGLALPAAGSYSYIQEGWEELCQASNCDRSDLPPSQTAEISFEKRSESRAVFVSETQGSGSRSQAITYDVRPDRAYIDRLESTFSSGAFRFTAEIVPDPPVVAAMFPLEVGDNWSGRWDDRNGHVDGTYSFDIAGRDRMTIDGRPEDVLILDTTMKLSGDYRGTNELRLWIVPEVFTIVASRGFTDIDSQYGTYRTRFTTSYRSGPVR